MKLITPMRLVAAGITLALFSGPVLAASIGLGMLLMMIGMVVTNEFRQRRRGAGATLQSQRRKARLLLAEQLRIMRTDRLSPTEFRWVRSRLWRAHIRRIRHLRRPRRERP